MKEVVERKFVISVEEICKLLKIDGDVVSCGFNCHKKCVKIGDREINIVTKKIVRKKK